MRKISGYRHPSQTNMVAFEAAVDEIAAASRNFLLSLKNRGQKVAKLGQLPLSKSGSMAFIE